MWLNVIQTFQKESNWLRRLIITLQRMHLGTAYLALNFMWCDRVLLCSISSQAVGDFENLQMLWDLTGPVWPNLKVLRCERPMPTAGQYFNSAATTRLWQKNVQVCRSFSSQPTALSLNSNYYCHSEGRCSTCFSCFFHGVAFSKTLWK